MKKMYEQFQDAIFKKVAEHLKLRFPHRSLELVHPNELILEDLTFLKNNNKMMWDAGIKSHFMIDIQEKHPIKLVIYYRGSPVGYAFGCYNENLCSAEVHWMEKRNDAHEDLDHQMLGIVLDTFSAYALFLDSQGMKCDTIAMVSPVEGAKAHYIECGFTFDAQYNRGASAMIISRVGKSGD